MKLAIRVFSQSELSIPTALCAQTQTKKKFWKRCKAALSKPSLVAPLSGLHFSLLEF